MSDLPPYAVTTQTLPVSNESPIDLNHQSIEIPGTRKAGQTGHYRNALFPNFTTVETPDKKFPRTDYEVFNFGLGRSYNKPCLGHRPINPVTGELEPFFVWQSYKDVDRRRTEFGSGMMHLQAEGKLGTSDRTGWTVGIWTHNRPEWQCVTCCAAYSLVVISLYETLGPTVVEYCINHSETRLVLSSASHIPDLLRNAHATPSLKVIISADRWQDLQPVEPKTVSAGDQRRALKSWGEQLGISIYDIEEVEALGRAHPTAHIPPSPDSVNSICYTSGTTGMPKGAVLLHRTITAACVGNLHGSAWAGAEDIFLSYLPLSHIFERFFEAIILAIGAPIGYSCGDNLRLLEDVQILKPTIFLSVPRVLNRIYQAVLAQLDGPGFKGSLGRKALQTKLQNLKTTGSNTHFLWDRLVFNKVKQALGGRVRIIGSGSAPISPDVISFLKVAFITQVAEGYGSTENSGTCTKCFGEDMEPNGTVGPPQAGQEIKLVDVPDMKYFSTDKPFPRGEICVRGEACIPAYYKDEAKTKELIDSEGWQHSGDIGLIDEKGRFKIIDRIKNLVKLAQGEYVALEKVEGAYSVSPLISQIYLHGDSLKSYLVAVIVPEPPVFQELANKVIGRVLPPEEACSSFEVRQAVLKEMEKTAASAKLLGFERIKNIHLTMEPFSVENELLTPTFKLKRPVAKTKYADVCQKLYEEHDAKGGEIKMKL
ncbi:uncharacterized protein PGTG_18556 [Puccinia graminis f. sp. tritici CRL 75-36-700-3]|uniref:AMP-dependent synthetase/ligase domain-containing protein n=1 Tax=Puccinia graminis f. sp. tritici (strain CRL 75-36-700-3 / race SCCL) TaxID=418459 RepID=E3L7N3_PUCGT|nr:uncharacterized protein PGTG_18556 [Puccinia graminis f. sp. tritici CRL 75-36-700-3]EFP92558.2 hypothetical protein PGTG_18556 [Puccinia graminis f. sp. tritici CRL 75-36-700-3]